MIKMEMTNSPMNDNYGNNPYAHRMKNILDEDSGSHIC